MKKTELKEIKGLDIKELTSRIGNAKKDLVGLVIEKNGQASAKGAKDLKLAAKKRRDIAQMFTILRQKQLMAELESRVASPVSSEEKTEVKKEAVKVAKKEKTSSKPKVIKETKKEKSQ